MDARSAKKRAVLARIASLQDAIVRAREYLERGDHADWPGFRPLFVSKRNGGRILPPHKDWVSNVFLPRTQKSLRQAEDALERLERNAALRSR